MHHASRHRAQTLACPGNCSTVYVTHARFSCKRLRSVAELSLTASNASAAGGRYESELCGRSLYSGLPAATRTFASHSVSEICRSSSSSLYFPWKLSMQPFSHGLAAWFHNCGKSALAKDLKLSSENRVLYAQTVGYPAATGQ